MSDSANTLVPDATGALADLRAEYLASRESRALSAMLRSETPANICRYCGRWWRRFPGSRLDGHAKCIVTDDFIARACALYALPTVRVGDIAAALGVSSAVVRSWCAPFGITRASRRLT